MPIVPPMVSAATGAALLAHLPCRPARETLLVACYACSGSACTASLVVITLLWSRLSHHGIGAAAAVPTLWIVLGPLGQSVTAWGPAGRAAPGVLAAPYGAAAAGLGVLSG